MKKSLAPRISVVIPAYNEEKLLPGCLQTVLSQNLPRSAYEVIVVNNASTDQTALLAHQSGAKVIFEGQKGYVSALRRGIKTARGEIVAITDADSRVPPDWLAKIEKQFEQDPQLVGLGGTYGFIDGSFLVRRLLAPVLQKVVFELAGPNMAFRKKAYEETGGFDPRVNLAADAIFSTKIRRVGKVKIDRTSRVLVSARRLRWKYTFHFLKYGLNYFCLQLFRRPLFLDFPDIR